MWGSVTGTVTTTMSVTSLIEEIRKKLNEIEELLETLEILQNRELVERIKEAFREYQEGRAKEFDNVEDAIRYLKSEEE